jgi:hypothetical protein
MDGKEYCKGNISNKDVAIVFKCPNCESICSVRDKLLLDSVNHQFDSNNEYTGVVHFHLFCSNCREYYIWET